MKKIVIYGCGVGAQTAARYIASDTKDQICAYTADAAHIKTKKFLGRPVVPFEEIQKKFSPKQYQLFIPLGFQDMNHLRAQKYREAKAKGYRLYSYISSKSFYHRKIECGENCFILEGQAINFDVKIGNDVVMWSANHVGDRTVIGDHVWLSSHVTIAGDAKIKDHCFLGINATISNHVTLAEETFVGAACFITKNTKKGEVYLAEGSKPGAPDSRSLVKILQASQKL